MLKAKALIAYASTDGWTGWHDGTSSNTSITIYAKEFKIVHALLTCVAPAIVADMRGGSHIA
jgi:hypothetical protein